MLSVSSQVLHDPPVALSRTTTTKVVAMRGDVNSPAGQRREVGDRLRSMRRWRLVISVVAVALGVVLVLIGNVVVGLVIGGLAAARLVLFSRFPVGAVRGRPNMSASDRQWFRDRAREEFFVAAGVIGCSVGELRDEFQGGRSIADVAAERSVDVHQVTAAIAADLTTKALAALGTGAISQDTVTRIHVVAPRFADRLVHRRASQPA
jgi:hypothetical protein